MQKNFPTMEDRSEHGMGVSHHTVTKSDNIMSIQFGKPFKSEPKILIVEDSSMIRKALVARIAEINSDIKYLNVETATWR